MFKKRHIKFIFSGEQSQTEQEQIPGLDRFRMPATRLPYISTAATSEQHTRHTIPSRRPKTTLVHQLEEPQASPAWQRDYDRLRARQSATRDRPIKDGHRRSAQKHYRERRDVEQNERAVQKLKRDQTERERLEQAEVWQSHEAHRQSEDRTRESQERHTQSEESIREESGQSRNRLGQLQERN